MGPRGSAPLPGGYHAPHRQHGLKRCRDSAPHSAPARTSPRRTRPFPDRRLAPRAAVLTEPPPRQHAPRPPRSEAVLPGPLPCRPAASSRRHSPPSPVRQHCAAVGLPSSAAARCAAMRRAPLVRSRCTGRGRAGRAPRGGAPRTLRRPRPWAAWSWATPAPCTRAVPRVAAGRAPHCASGPRAM
jgi:hypothetical protein